jgi:hypothetical protein
MMRGPKAIIQSIQVEPGDIRYVFREMERVYRDRAHKVDFPMGSGILAKKYGKNPALVFAIAERIRCLSMLMNDPRMEGWTIGEVRVGGAINDEAVIRAVATCPMSLDPSGDGFQFNSAEFFRIALNQAPGKDSA